jgi:hypothetical protein
MTKHFTYLALLALPLAFGFAPAHAADVDMACSTTEQAEVVIAGASTGNSLVVAVAQSVPTDPENCVPSYCVASSDKPDEVKVAVGAGISEAYAQLIAQGSENAASNLIGDACSSACDEVVLTAFAASQSSSVSGLCSTTLGGIGGVAPSILIIDSGAGSGGGQAASGN